MTAPLPATSPLAIAGAARPGPKASRTETFELPELPAAEAPDEATMPASEAEDPIPDMAAIIHAAPRAERALPVAPATAETLPPTPETSAQADAASEPRWPAVPPAAQPASQQTAAAQESGTGQPTSQPSQPTAQPPASHKPAPAEPPRLSPTHPAPAQQPPRQPTAGQPPADSREQPANHDQRSAPRAPSTSPAAPPTPPFRMEAIVPAPQALAAAAVQDGGPAPIAPAPPITPDIAADASPHTPDVVVELTAADALDVTISAATPDSLERLSAAEPDLRLELARLGAEVEAIRMELRPEPGAERNNPDTPDQRGEHGAQTPQDTNGRDANGRQGDRMTRHTESREAWQGRRLTAAPEAAQATQPSSGRIDRYA